LIQSRAYNNNGKIELIMEKIGGIKTCLNSQFLERKEAVDIIILAILSKKHSILIGEPGLAKTAILKALAKHIHGLKLFDFQMTPATDINDLLSKNTKNKIGIDNCDIALIDEFFKGPHHTLNSLLAIMNERVIYAPEPHKIPLISLFATSNEKPDKSSNENLLPLYDRFLFRKEILPINEKGNFKKLLEIQDDYDFQNIGLNLVDINLLTIAAGGVYFSDDIFNVLYEIREELKNKQVIVSDRRWKEVIRIIKVNAFLNGRDFVKTEDIKILESSLWTYYSDIRAVKNIIKRLTAQQFE
jgi:MoxR-like ATPase